MINKESIRIIKGVGTSFHSLKARQILESLGVETEDEIIPPD